METSQLVTDEAGAKNMYVCAFVSMYCILYLCKFRHVVREHYHAISILGDKEKICRMKMNG